MFDNGAVVEGDQCTVRYVVEITVTRSDAERAIVETDTFLWRALYAKFGDHPRVTRGDYSIAYDSYGDDMGHHPGHDRALLIEPMEGE